MTIKNTKRAMLRLATIRKAMFLFQLVTDDEIDHTHNALPKNIAASIDARMLSALSTLQPKTTSWTPQLLATRTVHCD